MDGGPCAVSHRLVSRPFYLITAIATPATNAKMTGMMHPQHIPPIFLCLPDLVHGMPVARLILDLAADTPRSRFHEKPP